MRQTLGEVRFADGSGARVLVDKPRLGRHRGRCLCHYEVAPSGRRVRSACLLPLHGTLLVSGSPTQVDERRRQLERLRRAPLAEAALSGLRSVGDVVLADEATVAALPERCRGVPATVALASLAAAVVGRQRRSVYWQHGGHRLLIVVEKGRPTAGKGGPALPCLLLTAPDQGGRALIRGLRPTKIEHLGGSGLRRLDGAELLALGVALARDQRGSFPAERRKRYQWGRRFWELAAVAALLCSCGFWVDRRSERTRLTTRMVELQQQLERLRWQQSVKIDDARTPSAAVEVTR